MSTHYFDYAASCPPFQEALEEFTSVSSHYYGNPASAHSLGRAAFKYLQKMKRKLAILCKWKHAKIVLTSGGTEANNLVIRGLLGKSPRGRLLLAADAHASAWFATELYRNRVDIVPLEKDGSLSVENINKSITKHTILLSAVHVCNETGIIHDIAALGKLCRENNFLFHCDGVQALGHIHVDLENVPVDFYTFSAHKFGGPRGTGGLLMIPNQLSAQIMGGDQEQQLRAGTENIAGFAAALAALEKCISKIPQETLRLQQLVQLFLDMLSQKVSDFLLNSTNEGLPGMVSVCFPGANGTNLTAEMSLRGFAISTGSACHSNDVEPSRIILSLGRSYQEALGTIRISMGRYTTEDKVKKLVVTLAQVVERQRFLQ